VAFGVGGGLVSWVLVVLVCLLVVYGLLNAWYWLMGGGVDRCGGLCLIVVLFLFGWVQVGGWFDYLFALFVFFAITMADLGQGPTGDVLKHPGATTT